MVRNSRRGIASRATLLAASALLCTSGCFFRVNRPAQNHCSDEHPACPAGETCRNGLCMAPDASSGQDMRAANDVRDDRGGDGSQHDARSSDGDAGATFYVNANSSSDNKTCTKDHPCKTIKQALVVVGSGAGRIEVAAGTYKECGLVVPAGVVLTGDVSAKGGDRTIDLQACGSGALTIGSGATLQGFKVSLACLLSSDSASVVVPLASVGSAPAVFESDTFVGTVCVHAIDVSAAVKISNSVFELAPASGSGPVFAVLTKEGECFAVEYLNTRFNVYPGELDHESALRGIQIRQSGCTCPDAPSTCVLDGCVANHDVYWRRCCGCSMEILAPLPPAQPITCTSPDCSPSFSCPSGS